MLKLYIIPCLFVFLSCASCSPLLSKFLNSIRCTRSIDRNLDPIQALNPNLNITNSFGYIYSMRNSIMEFNSDIEVQSTLNSAAEWLPSNVVALLTHVSYNEAEPKLTLRGRISASNLDKMFSSAHNTTTIDLSFDTLAFDIFSRTWYSQLKNGDGGISGKIKHMETIQRFGEGKEALQELLLDIIPLKKPESQYIKYMASNDVQAQREIEWSDNSKNVCKLGLIANQDKNYLNELVESAILL